MKKLISVGAAGLVVVLAAGCATIVKGSTQIITVNSNVDGADVLVDGLKVGVTPFTGVVPKNKQTLQVQKEGYKPTTVMLTTQLEPIFWGNIITGGTLGSITDFASGAAYQYAPAAYQADLKAAAQAQADFERRVAARKFAMLYLDQIVADLSRGQGEHLSALLSIVNGEAGTVGAAGIRQALAASEADPVRFGNQVVGLL